MSIGWRNCRNELEGTRAAAAAAARALALERSAAAAARAQRDHAYQRLTIVEEELTHRDQLLTNVEKRVAELRRDAGDRQRQLDAANELLRIEKEACELKRRECEALGAKVESALAVTALQSQELQRLRARLHAVTEQLAWWPAPLTRLMGVARSWLRRPMTFPEALVWSLVPARHGC